LKNFGVVYDDPFGIVELAPVYDLVTTTAYIRNDVPALTLAGTKKWRPCKLLERFAVVHLSLPKASVFSIFDRMAQAVTETDRSIPRYISEHPEFREVGKQMMAAWDEGLKETIGYG
jgi:serine/threonine-protein kinase HipA